MEYKLEFDEKTHTYWYGGHEMISVTRFVGQHFSKFYTDKIATKLAKFSKTGKTKEDFLKEWKGRADLGTEVHEALEEYLIMGDKFNAKAFKGESYNKIQSGIAFLNLNTNPDDMINPEMRVGSFKMGLAGTIDLPIFSKDRTVRVIDWKTNKKLTSIGFNGKKGTHFLTSHLDDCHMIKYGLQLSVYGHILEEEYGYKVKELILVHLRDYQYVEYKVPFMKELVIKMIEAKNDESKRITI